MIEVPIPDQGTMLWAKLMSGTLRYSGEKGLPMIHRPDLFTHSTRTLFLDIHLLEVADIVDEGEEFPVDELKSKRMARHHDDPELITEDILTVIKMAMTSQEKAALERRELDVIPMIARFILGLSGQVYEDYVSWQHELQGKGSNAAQLADVADKWDALGEKLHEIRCGNDEVFLPTLEVSKKQFEKFENYPVWRKIRDFGTLDLETFPLAKDLKGLPKLNMEEIRDAGKANLAESLGKAIDQWPAIYRTWVATSIKSFYHNPEKHLLQGWCLNLWEKWGIPPGTVTNAGIILSQ